MAGTDPVLVVGAGIAGLTAALALARKGFAVHVMERASRLEEVGAGLQLSPNALRVLAVLDVLPMLRLHAVEADEVELRDLRSARRLALVPVRGTDGTPYLSVRRADLQTALLEAARRHPDIALDLGSRFTGLRWRAEEIVASFATDEGDVRSIRARATIGADGFGSTVATAIGHPQPRSDGAVAHRLTMPAGDDGLRGITAWLGASCHVVAYPVDARRRINVVVASRRTAADIRRRLENSAAPLLRRVAESLPDATAWPLATVDRKRWPADPPNLLLLGDAAHAMLPYAAQGAALAIEDGFVAAHHLANASDPASAWRDFETERRPRWDAVRRRVAFHRFVYHLPPPASFARDLVLAARPPESLARDLAWLYDWRPPV